MICVHKHDSTAKAEQKYLNMMPDHSVILALRSTSVDVMSAELHVAKAKCNDTFCPCPRDPQWLGNSAI